MKLLQITDDSGFLGIANFDKYNSFISKEWDFEIIKERIVSEINAHNLLFWETGLEGFWKVRIDDQPSDKDSFREERGVIEISNRKLFLTNYESLTMAAQFEKIKLPEKHLEGLFVELDNGKYMVKFRQMFDPRADKIDWDQVHFEIVIMKIENLPSIYKNKVKGIYWFGV